MAAKKELFKVELDEVGKLAVEFLDLKDQRKALDEKIKKAGDNLIEAMKATERRTLNLKGLSITLKSTPSKDTLTIKKYKE